MSALWTPNRGTDRLCGVMTAEPGTLTPGPAVFSPAGHRPAPAQEPGDHGSTPAPAPAPSPLSRPTCTRLGLSWSGVVRTARSPGKPPIGVSDVMTSETLRSHETTQKPGPSWSAPDCRPVAPHPRAVRAQRHHSDHTRPFGDATNRVPSATRSSTPLPARRPATPAPGNPPHLCLRCHDIRNPQTP